MKKIICSFTVVIALCLMIINVNAIDNERLNSTTIPNIPAYTGAAITPRGIVLDPLYKEVTLKGGTVSGTIKFYVYLNHNATTNRVTISNVSPVHNLKKTTNIYSGDITVIILSVDPSIGSVYNGPVNIEYQVKIGRTPVIISNVTIE